MQRLFLFIMASFLITSLQACAVYSDGYAPAIYVPPPAVNYSPRYRVITPMPMPRYYPNYQPYGHFERGHHHGYERRGYEQRGHGHHGRY